MPAWILTIIGIVFSGLVGGSFLSFVLERRKKKAQGLVATRTVEFQVDAAAMGNEAAKMQLIEDRLQLIDEANRQERESLVRTIGNLRGDLTRSLSRLQEVEDELVEMTRRHRLAINYIRLLLAHVNEHSPHDPAPPIPDELDLNV